MEKRNTLLLTVIAVATLLVAVVGATFAYFASTANTNATLNLNTTTVASTASLTAGATQLSMEVTPDLMQQSTANNTVAKNTTGNITVELTSDAAATCFYDIAFAWDASSDTYTPTNGIGESKEFTVQATYDATTGTSTPGTNNISAETQINTIAAMTGTDGSIADTVTTGLVVDEASISSSGAQAVATWTFDVRFYNLTIDQTTQAPASYTGTFKVVNVAC